MQNVCTCRHIQIIMSLCSPVEITDTFEGAHAVGVPVTDSRAKKKTGVSQGQLIILTSFCAVWLM